MTIAAVTATRCAVPLERSLHLGGAVIEARDYVVVEVTTSDGVVGRAIGNARNAPIDAIVRTTIAPLVIGLDALRTEHVWGRMYYGCLPIGQRGGSMSAISLVDICCWDIKAQVAGMPLATLLGGYCDEVDVSIAGGYPELTPDPESMKDEVARLLDAGYRSVKLAAHGSPGDTARLSAARDVCGREIDLMVDVHWTWRDLHTAIRSTREWGDLDLAWIEDPFPARLGALIGPFKRAINIPVAVGEDRAGLDDFVHVLEQDADVLRIDATVCGGVTEFLRIAAVAASRGRSVSPHVFPEIHVHLAAGVQNVLGIETLEQDSAVTPIYRLLAPLGVQLGTAAPPQGPGIGLTFDVEALQHYACE